MQKNENNLGRGMKLKAVGNCTCQLIWCIHYQTILNSEDNNLLNLHFDTEVDLDDSMNAVVDDLFTHSNANEDEVIDSSVLFSVIEPETYIGLRSPTSSLGLFFVIKVVSKRIAEVNKVDTHGHRW